jgi:penicillin amidase
LTSPTSKLVVSAIVLTAVAYVSMRPVGPAPALGDFLDPARGVWGVAYSAELPAEQVSRIPGLDGEVTVVYDDRHVPHIFANTVSDAYRAQGWVVARDRLFEMELQTRATAGTLTELVGERALPGDRASRQLGLAWAAERDWARSHGASFLRPMEAYAEGVQAYIRSMRPADLPIEYHLFGAEPLMWEAVHTAYLLNRMGRTLAFSATERRKAYVAARVGREAADALIPVNSPIQEPIEPHDGTRFVPTHIPPPGEPDPASAVQVRALRAFLDPFEDSRGYDGPVNGSNNWVVGPSRSETGNPILSGDPHLSLTLPSIWYEVHLVVPGELDVYGVTLAGTPGVVIGFNRDVAWSFTNTGNDVLDYYRERLDDEENPTRYMLDGEWRPLEQRVETYRDGAGDVIAVDTLVHTHRGPVLDIDGHPTSIRWTVLEGSGGFPGPMAGNTAGSVEEWMEIMAGWQAPNQNGIVADRDGHIGIQSAGFYPVRPDPTTGDWFYDGTTTRSDWQGRLERFPRSVDPEQGYLASANQQPVDPAAFGAFMGGDWPAPWRAMTINGLLRSKERHSAADLHAYQTHPTGARVTVFLPALLDAAQRLAEAGTSTPETAEAAALLAEWNGGYTPDNERAALFEEAMTQLQRHLWDELDDENGRRRATPGTDVTWALLDQPESPWWDDRSTEAVEDRDAFIGLSLSRALGSLRERRGPEGEGGWAWGTVLPKNVYHLLGIPALSRTNLPVTGGPSLLSPNSGGGTHGASWRMVVELGDEIRPRGTYPGGQSGNPLSPSYDDRMDHWVAGELEALHFPRTSDELTGTLSRLTLTGGAR